MHLLIALLTTCALTVFAPSSLAETTEKLKSALASDIRSDAAKTRDANRKPIETLTFFGLQDDMTVLELFPGGGWYTKILAPVLNENGKLYEAMGTNGIAALSAYDDFSQMEILDVKANMTKPPGELFYSLSDQILDLGVSGNDTSW